jgi:uncharacterized membrane protein
MKLMKNSHFFLIILVVFSSCASRPQLYPNAKYKTAGKEVAKKDIDKCMADADTFLESSKGKKIAKGAGGGAAIGAAMGAVWGAFSGNMARGAVRGGAVGAAGGAAGAAMTPDQIKHNYVNQCLGQLGYQVIGWD